MVLKEGCNLQGVLRWAPSALPTPAACLFVRAEAMVSGLKYVSLSLAKKKYIPRKRTALVQHHSPVVI